MQQFLSAEEMARLGCEGGAVHTVAPLSVSRQEWALSSASVIPGTVEEAMQPAALARFERIAHPAAAALDLVLSVHPAAPRFLQICDERRRPVLIVSGEGMRSGRESHFVCVDLLTPGLAVVQESMGRLLVVRRDGASARAGVLEPAPIEAPPLSALETPTEAWLAELRSPAWLVKSCESRARAGDRFSLAVLAGLLAAYAEAPLATEARAWAKRWTPGQRETALDLAMQEIGRLGSRLEWLEDNLSSDPAWTRSLQRLCLERDDLECVVICLAETGRPSALLECVGALDAEALAFVEALPDPPALNDERLFAAAALEPDAWWTVLTC